MLGKEATLHYLPAAYEIIAPGDYVLCAISGKRIPLIALRYWNAEKQEAYFDAGAALAAKQKND